MVAQALEVQEVVKTASAISATGLFTLHRNVESSMNAATNVMNIATDCHKEVAAGTCYNFNKAGHIQRIVLNPHLMQKPATNLANRDKFLHCSLVR